MVRARNVIPALASTSVHMLSHELTALPCTLFLVARWSWQW